MIDTTVSAAYSAQLAEQVTAAFKAGEVSTVNGRALTSRFGIVASSWQNGSVSFKVVGRSKGKVGEVFVKAGERLTVS